MIIGVGIDIVQVKRMERWLLNEKLLKRFFAKDELEYILVLNKRASQSLAVRFAAKEAFGKALGTGLADFALKDVSIINKNGGQPELKLADSALKAFEKSGANKAHVSLSHEKDYAAAIVILER